MRDWQITLLQSIERTTKADRRIQKIFNEMQVFKINHPTEETGENDLSGAEGN